MKASDPYLPGSVWTFWDASGLFVGGLVGSLVAISLAIAVNGGEELGQVPLLLAPLFAIARDEPPILWARWQNAVFGTVAVLLPGCSYFLSVEQAPARRILDADLPAAIATDYNPGSAMMESLPQVMNIACTPGCFRSRAIWANPA